MSYQSSTIAAVLNRLNRSYFLPAIQREFVWSPDQVIKFFDSLMRRYPIGSFLFWDLSPERAMRNGKFIVFLRAYIKAAHTTSWP